MPDKKKGKLQVPVKMDEIKDSAIYDMVYYSDDRTGLIKNALFYYLYEIENGKVRDRHYPYGKINNITTVPEETKQIETSYEDDIIEEDLYEYVEEYDEDDNIDDLDI